MVKIHTLADVQSEQVGYGTTIWQYAVILSGASIGKNCNINCHTFIENDVIIGDEVTIKSGVYLWDGLVIEDNVFIGPSVVFTNDIRPRSKQYKSFEITRIQNGASIGANATILGGITIGKYAMVGMGSVVTKNVPDYSLCYGNPAKVMGWVDENGEKMKKVGENKYLCSKGHRYLLTENGLIKQL